MRKLIFYTVLFFSGTALLLNYRKETFRGIFSLHELEKEWESEYEEEEEEEKFDKPDKFLEFHRGIRTRDGESAPSYSTGYKWKELERSRLQSARKRTGARTKTNGVLEWKERGPGNVPGRTRALLNVAGDATNNTWLAGAATGGIWRTTDGGNTWSDRSSDFPVIPISSFGADANATVIYAGTGEYVSSVFSALGNGIFKSTDKGLTWTQLPSTNNHPEFTIVTRLAVNPADGNIIVATTVPSNLSTDNTSAIMRSIDGGATWTKVKEITGIFEQIIATPTNFNVQYASQNGVGIWKSVDAGVTWNLSSTGIVSDGRIEIAVSPVNPNRVFAASEGTFSGSNSDLYFSNDAGATWSIVDVRFNSNVVDFFEGQGFYDNTIMCDPFDQSKVYFGGVSLFRSTVAGGASSIDFFHMIPSNTESFLFLQAFTNIAHDEQRLTVGEFKTITVEVRFGPGKSQTAHRFMVPAGATSGVPVTSYAFQDYVNIPCEVWDVTNNQQLMVSFRDQNRNGKFDLIPAGFPEGDPLAHSREYFYINNVAYSSTTPNSSIAVNGGQEFKLIYNFFPSLAAGGTWNEASLPDSKLTIKNDPVTKVSATTVTVADGRGSFDKKNPSNQQTLSAGVHPDHHFMMPVIDNQAQQVYRIVLANDGGVFVSRSVTEPGITEADWTFKGMGLNTSQFYGADKRPGADQYIGGMQDNGTRFSPQNESASATSSYIYGLGGDGFEVIWNSRDPQMIIGSIYNGKFNRTTNGGNTWTQATTGLPTTDTEFSFVTKIANSKDFPDRVFTPGLQGVYKSEDFGGQWTLTAIPQKFVIGTSFYLDVEVSRANPNIIWAGSGMNNTGTLRNLHVSNNGGASYTATNNFTTVPLGNITKLASHPTQQNTAYALFSFANAPKILRTTDLGNTWEDISGFGTGSSSVNGFPNVAVYCLYVRPDDPNIIWVGTEIGIVESLDNGTTWALIDDFINVSVWDMKGQDDQVVIATHGRGIWTATIDQSQIVGKSAEIIGSGTTPAEKLALRIQALENYDSVFVYLNNVLTKKIYTMTVGTFDTDLGTQSPGAKEIKLISYKGKTPVQSFTHKMNHIDLFAKVSSYSNYLSTVIDLDLTPGLVLASFPGKSGNQRKALHTSHIYQANKTYQVIFKKPVTVSSTFSTFFYRDLALLEPNNDALRVEATKNGIDWIELDKHDASFNADWQSAFTNNTTPTQSMYVQHEFDLKEKFAAGDDLIFRMIIESNASVTGWGWSLDYVSIQEPPVGIEQSYDLFAVTAYPNPSKENFTINYSLRKESEVSLKVMDMYGRTVRTNNLGRKNAGNNSESFSLEGAQAGTYVVMLATSEGKKMTKISLVR